MDGVVRKRDGKLVDVVVDEKAMEAVGKDRLTWKDVAREVEKSRERMQGEIDEIDFEETRSALLKVFYLDEKTCVDEG